MRLLQIVGFRNAQRQSNNYNICWSVAIYFQVCYHFFMVSEALTLISFELFPVCLTW